MVTVYLQFIFWGEKSPLFDTSVLCARLGIVIVGEDTVGCYDLGIFVASIVPGGPADKDGRVRPGKSFCGSFSFLKFCFRLSVGKAFTLEK